MDANGWMPIESAPKDGTFVDCWVPAAGGGRIADVKWVVPDRNFRGEACWCNWQYLDGWEEIHPQPTYWKPLPAPPENEDGR